jgi:hypothetical protein
MDDEDDLPAQGNTEGYSWQFTSVIQDNFLHGERGTAGEPGYFTLDGKVAENGNAKLNGSGIVMSRKYAKSIFAHEGADYSYDVKAKFEGTQGPVQGITGWELKGAPAPLNLRGSSLPAAGRLRSKRGCGGRTREPVVGERIDGAGLAKGAGLLLG